MTTHQQLTNNVDTRDPTGSKNECGPKNLEINRECMQKIYDIYKCLVNKNDSYVHSLHRHLLISIIVIEMSK